jgi:hypothetical protein
MFPGFRRAREYEWAAAWKAIAGIRAPLSASETYASIHYPDELGSILMWATY